MSFFKILFKDKYILIYGAKLKYVSFIWTLVVGTSWYQDRLQTCTRRQLGQKQNIIEKRCLSKGCRPKLQIVLETQEIRVLFKDTKDHNKTLNKSRGIKHIIYFATRWETRVASNTKQILDKVDIFQFK